MDEAYWYQHTVPSMSFAVMWKDNTYGRMRMYSRFSSDANARRWLERHGQKGWTPEFLFTIEHVNAYHATRTAA